LLTEIEKILKKWPYYNCGFSESESFKVFK
jgi:hypothetical protein